MSAVSPCYWYEAALPVLGTSSIDEAGTRLLYPNVYYKGPHHTSACKLQAETEHPDACQRYPYPVDGEWVSGRGHLSLTYGDAVACSSHIIVSTEA